MVITVPPTEVIVSPHKYAIADAGADLCGDTITYVGGTVITNYYGSTSLNYLWTTTGSGTFANANLSSTSYHASNADVASGQTKIYFKPIDGVGECTYSKDSVMLCVCKPLLQL